MSVAVWLAPEDTTSQTILSVVIGISVYGAGIIILKGFNKTEISFFKGLLQQVPFLGWKTAKEDNINPMDYNSRDFILRTILARAESRGKHNLQSGKKYLQNIFQW